MHIPLPGFRTVDVTGQLDNATALRDARREVARLMTELRAREIRAAEALEETTDA